MIDSIDFREKLRHIKEPRIKEKKYILKQMNEEDI